MLVNSLQMIKYEYKQFYFDIFIKNNYIYLICPIYMVTNRGNRSVKVTKIDFGKLQLSINNKSLKLISRILQPPNKTVCIEPIEILIYKYIDNLSTVHFTLNHKNIVTEYTLPHIKTETINKLALTTLFKNDYYLFPLFYQYYKTQGVDHFYMYYNGKLTDTIHSLFDYEDVTLIEWDFQYWNESCKYGAHAQIGQINHALYRFGKDLSDYMVYCDLDEYMHIPNKTIIEYINDNKHIDMFSFNNYWCNTLDNKIPKTFPNKIYYEKDKCIIRNKNIYKISSIRSVYVHTCTHFISENPVKDINNMLLHFYNWSKKDRDYDISEIYTIS